MKSEAVFSFLKTDLALWEIGPYHDMLPGPMCLKLKLDGEIIVSAAFETGYAHRGLEKAFELHSWLAGIPYSDHLDPGGEVFGEIAFCNAVEEIGKIDVPSRAQSVRVIVAELTRVSAHLGYLVRMARAVGAETLVHYVLRDREKILDLFELLTGARFSLNFLRLGGVRADVTEGFIERVLDVCDLVQIRIKEYNDLFSFNYAFLKRTCFVGILSSDQALKHGVTGPNLRATGVPFDVRKLHPYSAYEQIDFEVPVGRGERGAVGDAHDRFLLRLREIAQSLGILKQACTGIPSGAFSSLPKKQKFSISAGEAYSRIESPRGLLGCHVISEGGGCPSRVQFRVPSLGHLMVIPELLKGEKMGNLPVVLASLDVGVAEVDR